MGITPKNHVKKQWQSDKCRRWEATRVDRCETRLCCPREMVYVPITEEALMQVYSSSAGGTWCGVRCQISSAYCLMVRSDENFPMPAHDMMDISAQRAWSCQTSSMRF